MSAGKSDNPFKSGGTHRAFAAARKAKPATDDEAAEGEAPTTKKKGAIALTQIDGPDGEIVHIEQGERYSGEAQTDRARITIRHGSRKKSGKKGIPDSIDEKRTELHLKPHQIKGLKVGDRVSIHLRKH